MLHVGIPFLSPQTKPAGKAWLASDSTAADKLMMDHGRFSDIVCLVKQCNKWSCTVLYKCIWHMTLCDLAHQELHVPTIPDRQNLRYI